MKEGPLDIGRPRFARAVASPRAIAFSRSSSLLRGMLPADLLALVYLTVCSTVLIIGRERLSEWPLYLGVHLALFAGVVCLRFLPAPRTILLSLLRHGYPLFMMTFAYRELAVLNRLVTDRYFDPQVIGWDKALFTLHPHVMLHHWAPAAGVSEFLHLSYFSYAFLIPLLGLTLLLTRRDAALRVATTTVMLAQYSCYVMFIFFPVKGPWYTFEHPQVAGTIFPHLVRIYLEKGAAVGTAFPSSHVAGSIAVAAMALRFLPKKLSVPVTVLVAGIFFGTMYGGFHYGIDALVGLTFGLLVAMNGPRLHTALLRICRAAGVAEEKTAVRGLRRPPLRAIPLEPRVSLEMPASLEMPDSHEMPETTPPSRDPARGVPQAIPQSARRITRTVTSSGAAAPPRNRSRS